MAYVISTPQLGIPKITDTFTATELLALGISAGQIIQAKDETYGSGEFICLLGAASTAVGSWVTYNSDDNSTTLLAANAIGPVAVAMSANTSTSSYGFYQIQGKAIGKALTGFVDNANVYATATAGSVDDAVVAGDRVKNAKGASAVDTPSTGLAEFEIARPWMDDALAA